MSAKSDKNLKDLMGHNPHYGEVVEHDGYKLRSLLIFKPDVVFDLGANLGMVTHYAHSLFPEALVVAVEPHAANFAGLREMPPSDRIVLLNKAIGVGVVRRYPDVRWPGKNHVSSGESYFTAGYGYEAPHLEGHPVEDTNIESVMLDELVAEYVKPGQRYMVKVDVEGAENLMFHHPPTIEALQRADFVAMELHPYWMPGLEVGHRDRKKAGKNDDAIAETAAVLFRGTHRWDSERPLFFAWRAPDGEPIVSRAEFGRLLKERGVTAARCAEIGVASGNYSRDILSWGVEHLYSVDPWYEQPEARCGISDARHEENYQETLEKVRPYGDRCTVLRMFSTEAAEQVPDGSLDFCYIDANHRYEGIVVDLPTWWPKVKSGGIIAGHDYLEMSLGVNRAVTEFAAEHDLRVHLVIEHQRDASFWIEKP